MELKEIRPSQEQEYTEAEMLRRMNIARKRLSGVASLSEARKTAEQLVADGILNTEGYEDGPHNEELYFVPDAEPGTFGSHNILSIERSPDFHTGKGWKTISFTVTLFDEQGREVSSVRRSSETNEIGRESHCQYFPDGSVQRSEISDWDRTEISEYDPDNPNKKIYHCYIDKKDGKERVVIDERELAS